MPSEPPNRTSAARRITKFEGSAASPADDRLALEEPLEIRLGNEALAITMRTPGAPGDDAELAAGFCLTEGLIRHPDDLESATPCAIADYGNVVIVKLSDEAMGQRAAKIQRARRELYMSSSCGLCGKQTLDRIEQEIRPIVGNFKISTGVLGKLPEVMRQAQATFDQTGGLHAAALFTPDGQLRVLREDVGRHNAVDKVIGWATLRGEMPIDPAVLLVSGRSSFEIMQKAAAAGIAVVAAVSAPSSLAADFATRMKMTLVGFLRPGRMNLYAGAERIAD